MPDWPRIIAHADMDAFYAAVEQRDDPSLVGKPLIVGPKSRRGVVLTASYEARPYGVGSAMPMALALRRCPHAVVVPPRFERYAAVSKQVMHVFARFSPQVEPISLDEAFIELSGSAHLFGGIAATARAIKDGVREATGLVVSVGVSATKFVAKVASGYGKPDALTIVPPESVREWLAPMPVNQLWGVGKKTELRLHGLGYVRIHDLAEADPARLRRQLGNLGAHLRALARGEDTRHVARRRVAHSMGSDRTLELDVATMAAIDPHLRRAADRLGRRLREKNLVAAGIRVRLKTTAFQLLTRQARLQRATDLGEAIYRAAVPLARVLLPRGPFRLVGIAVYEMQSVDEQGAHAQSDLFADTARQQRLERTLDAVIGKFGGGSLKRARELGRGGTVMGDAPTLDGFDGLEDANQPSGLRDIDEDWVDYDDTDDS